jgi:hypothetical protein
MLSAAGVAADGSTVGSVAEGMPAKFGAALGADAARETLTVEPAVPDPEDPPPHPASIRMGKASMTVMPIQ